MKCQRAGMRRALVVIYRLWVRTVRITCGPFPNMPAAAQEAIAKPERLVKPRVPSDNSRSRRQQGHTGRFELSPTVPVPVCDPIDSKHLSSGVLKRSGTIGNMPENLTVVFTASSRVLPSPFFISPLANRVGPDFDPPLFVRVSARIVKNDRFVLGKRRDFHKY